MSVTPNVITSTEYRNSDKELICRATPGKVFLGVYFLHSQAEVEECIDALRKAAKEANLPDVNPEK